MLKNEQLNNELKADAALEAREKEALSNCAKICRKCEYVEIDIDGECVFASCHIIDNVCPPLFTTVCPAAKILYECYFKDLIYCFRWIEIDEFSLSDDYCDRGFDVTFHKTLDNFLNEDCKHTRVSTYHEPRINDEYSHVCVCLDCGHFNLIKR